MEHLLYYHNIHIHEKKQTALTEYEFTYKYL